MIQDPFRAAGIRIGHRALSGVTVGLLLCALWVVGAVPAHAAPSVTASPTSDVQDGATVSVSGAGFDPSKGIYIAYCVVPAGGGLPTPCGGGVDMSGSTGASVWISNDPPPYGQDLARPFDSGGSFQTSVTVSSTIGSYDCREVTCAIVTRADHLRPSDRSQDTAVVISFADATPEPPPEPDPTPPPETPAPDPEPPVEEQPEPVDPPEQTTPEPDPGPEDADTAEDTAVEEDEEVDDEERVPPPPGDGPPLPPVPNADHYAAMVRANSARLADAEPEPSAPIAATPAPEETSSRLGAVAVGATAAGLIALIVAAVVLTRRARRGSSTEAAAAGDDLDDHTPTPTSSGRP